MADNEWIEHESAVNDVWKYFLRSKIKISGKANRFRAKCKRCDAVMIGRPQRMMKHLISVCKKISFEDRAMIMEVKEDKSSVSSPSTTSGETTAAVEKKQKSNMKSIKAFYKPVKLSEKEENDLNLAFLRAVVNGGVSFSFAENCYLSEWVGMLKHSYKIPCRSTLTDNYLVQLYVEACRVRDEALQKVSCCTLLWDGWTDVSHQPIYALMVVHQTSGIKRATGCCKFFKR